MNEGIAVAIIAILIILTIVGGLTIWFIFMARELLLSAIRRNNEMLVSIIETHQKFTAADRVQIAAQVDQLTSTLEKDVNLMKQNQELLRKQAEYKMFFSLIFETLTEDTLFIRSEFFRRFANIPEYQDINSKIIAFETKIEQTRILLKEQNMLETFGE